MEIEAELEIIYTYLRLHYAFGRIPHPDDFIPSGDTHFATRERNIIYEDWGTYVPNNPDNINEQGINAIQYLSTRFYYHRAGVELSYDLIVDYFSEEFEPDGTLRLYNNGNHPEMEAFVTWMWEGRRGEEFVNEYVLSIASFYDWYSINNRDQGFQGQGTSIWDISPQMLDALARREADPAYILDLTSLQEAGY